MCLVQKLLTGSAAQAAVRWTWLGTVWRAPRVPAAPVYVPLPIRWRRAHRFSSIIQFRHLRERQLRTRSTLPEKCQENCGGVLGSPILDGIFVRDHQISHWDAIASANSLTVPRRMAIRVSGV